MPGSVESGGAKIAYDDFGAGHAVLFIHGHPFNRTMWRPQVQSLRWKYRTIAPDLRGYGESAAGREPVTGLESITGDLIQMLDALAIDRVCLVGLSMGGQVAMEFGRAHPDRTAGAIFAATFPQAETREGAELRNRTADRILVEGIAATGCEMLPKLIGRTSLRKMPSLASTVFAMICSTDPAGAAAAIRGRALRRDYRADLRNFHFPCLIVLGAEDSYASLQQAQEMNAAIPNSQLQIFPEAGHMPNLENEDMFNRLLHGFLAGISW